MLSRAVPGRAGAAFPFARDFREERRGLLAEPNTGDPVRDKEYVELMKRPSKKEIKAAIDKLKSPEGPADIPEAPNAAVQAKKPNKNRIRKQGV
jgi:hypothetical protein